MASFLRQPNILKFQRRIMYTNRSKQAFEQDIDWAKIDATAKINPAVREKQLSEMINILRHTGAFFDFVNADKVQAIATRLQSNRIGVVSLRKASERIIQGFDRFPSYKAIYELCRTIPVEPYDAEWEKHREVMTNKEKELKPIREKFLQVFGEEGLGKCVEWWIKANFDIDKTMIESFLQASPSFEKCVLFDWKDAGFPTKHFEVKMKEVFDKKKAKQQNAKGPERILP